MSLSDTKPIRCRGGGPGFTLIEIIVALVIMSLLTAAAALSFSGPMRRAAMVEGVEQVRYLDASSRDLARRFGRPVRLNFDLTEGRMERRDSADSQAPFTTHLGRSIRIAAIWTAAKGIDSGETSIPISSAGISPTYAIKLRGTEGDQWVVISGLSGQVSRLNDDAQVQAIFSTASATRRDTD